MFKMIHQNFNVLDLERSLAFYSEALDLKEARRINAKREGLVRERRDYGLVEFCG